MWRVDVFKFEYKRNKKGSTPKFYYPKFDSIGFSFSSQVSRNYWTTTALLYFYWLSRREYFAPLVNSIRLIGKLYSLEYHGTKIRCTGWTIHFSSTLKRNFMSFIITKENDGELRKVANPDLRTFPSPCAADFPCTWKS